MKSLYHFGKYVLMLKKLFVRPENFYMYWKEMVRQMNNIGTKSLIIIGLLSIFVGAVTSLQFAYQLGNSLIPVYLLGYIIRDMMLIELAPTLSCLILAGKVGSNIASELGTMRTSEQIDALEIMGIDSTAYLIAPKILASLIIVPPLIIIAAFLGMIGGLLSAANYGIAPEVFQKGLVYIFTPFNVVIMLVKSVVFGFLVTSIACYQGYYVQGGTLEIGKASTNAVVLGSILIVLFDYIIALLMT